jgi:hypothetical protein
LTKENEPKVRALFLRCFLKIFTKIFKNRHKKQPSTLNASFAAAFYGYTDEKDIPIPLKNQGLLLDYTYSFFNV